MPSAEDSTLASKVLAGARASVAALTEQVPSHHVPLSTLHFWPGREEERPAKVAIRCVKKS